MTRADRFLHSIRTALRTLISGPQVLAFMPAVTLAAFWLGGEAALLFAAFLVPAAFAAAGVFRRSGFGAMPPLDGVTGLPFRDTGEAHIDALLSPGNNTPETLAVVAVGLDDIDELRDQYGGTSFKAVVTAAGGRLGATMRATDLVVRLSDTDFAIVLSGAARADIETMIQIAARVQSAIAEPIVIDGTRVYVTASVGFCLARQIPEPTGKTVLRAAEQALGDARGHGAASIRGYAYRASAATGPETDLVAEIEEALLKGEIVPWFQPQIRIDTGEVSGVEALARWSHPARGLVGPSDFMPAVEAMGLSERLGEVMLQDALSALASWDRAGLHVPHVGINFATAELCNPSLPDRVRWELDRFALSPDRLTVEILETVISPPDDDIIARNLSALAAMGCGIDLDDFGTGHAAIASIRRFSVKRVKIDRSFVTRLDRDPAQQDVVSAILLMAGRLDLETVAEGVETPEEHGVLGRIGCRHVQGYGIARPMPADAFLSWLIERTAPTDAGRPDMVTSACAEPSDPGKTA